MEMHAILKKLALPFVATVLLFCLHATAAVTLYAQGSSEPMTITGTVVDKDGAPLPGATIRIAGTTQGTSTDGNGAFTLKVRPGRTLEILYMGYETQTVQVSRNRTKYNITLSEDENVLQEVVMIGYGSVKKEDLTGSVTNVKMADIQSLPVLSVDNALQGRIAGADFMSTDGAPGSTTTVRIRGSRSITASNEPLYVVDGIIDAIHDLNDINADDIANISVLKDASSTAIYGSRGANGVIIITTKQGQGQKDKTNITFKSDIGFSQLPKKLDIMNASELQIYRNEVVSFGGDSNAAAAGIASGLDVPLYLSRFKDPLAAGQGTDWIDEVTRTAITQNYALSLSGRTDASSRYASFSYNDTQGIVQGSGQKRFTGRINLDRKLFKWLKVGYNGSYTWRDNDENKTNIGGSSWTNGAIYLSPLMKPEDTINDFYYSGSWINSPRALIDMNVHYLVRHSMSHNFTAVITPIKNFEIRSTASYYYYQRHTYQYQPGTLPTKIQGDEGGYAYRAVPVLREYRDLQVEDRKALLRLHGRTFLLYFRKQQLLTFRKRVHGRCRHVEQHERGPGQGNLQRRNWLLRERKILRLRTFQLELWLPLLPDCDGPAGRRLQLRPEQQVRNLPFRRFHMEQRQRTVVEGCHMAR